MKLTDDIIEKAVLCMLTQELKEDKVKALIAVSEKLLLPREIQEDYTFEDCKKYMKEKIYNS